MTRTSPPPAVRYNRTILRIALLSALTPFMAAMTCGPDPGPDPCELDRLGCEDPEPTEDFYLASCPPDVVGALTVEVGTGESTFSGFAPATGPVVHFGLQNGQHVFMGVRVANARVDISPRLKVRFYLGQGAGCAPPEAGTTTIPECSVLLGQRALVLGSTGFELHTNAQGAVEEAGLVVFVGVPASDLPGLVAVSVEDQCRRTGAGFQSWTKY